MDTRVVPFSPTAIEEAAMLIAAGSIVAVPTETVYGLAADAGDARAVAAIYAAKGRPSFNPLIVHVSDLAAAEAIAEVDPASRRLADRFWPGPLTIVAPLRPEGGIAALATAGLATVALRVPAHPAIRALLAATGRPLAAPSANSSNGLSPTRADHVVRSLAGRIPLVIDGGRCAVGIESTIVRVVGHMLEILRPGPIVAETLAAASGLQIALSTGDAVVAPGQLALHYAPAKPLRLEATLARAGEWLIGYGPVAGDATLSATGDLAEAAARLFDLLHEADRGAARAIAVAPVPDQGLGVAINDRLRRAAA